MSPDWTVVELSGKDGSIQSKYLDFDISINRIQLRLTQLQDNSNLRFSLMASFYEQDSPSSMIASLTYTWNTHSGRTNKLSLNNSMEFDNCDEDKSELLKSIPSLITVDLNTDYLVDIKRGQRGTFSSAKTEPCPVVWTSFKAHRVLIKKVIIKLENMDSSYKLQDYYAISYRVITGKLQVKIHDYFSMQLFF